MLRQKERDAAIVRPHRLETGPDHLAGRTQGVQIALQVTDDAGGKRLALQGGGEQRRAFELRNCRKQGLATGARRRQPLPGGQKARVGGVLDRLDLGAQPGQRPAPEHPQDLQVTQLPPLSPGQQLTFEQLAAVQETAKHRLRRRDPQSEAGRRRLDMERTVGAREPTEQIPQRVRDGGEQRLRQALGKHRAQGVAVAARILDRDVAALSSDAHSDHPALGFELRQHILERARGLGADRRTRPQLVQ